MLYVGLHAWNASMYGGMCAVTEPQHPGSPTFTSALMHKDSILAASYNTTYTCTAWKISCKINATHAATMD